MNEGFRNLVEKAGVLFDADLVVLDEDYSVIETFCKGIAQSVYFNEVGIAGF